MEKKLKNVTAQVMYFFLTHPHIYLLSHKGAKHSLQYFPSVETKGWREQCSVKRKDGNNGDGGRIDHIDAL